MENLQIHELRDSYREETKESTMTSGDYPHYTFRYVDWLECMICNQSPSDDRYFLVFFRTGKKENGVSSFIGKRFVSRKSIRKHIEKEFKTEDYAITNIIELSKWDYEEFILE